MGSPVFSGGRVRRATESAANSFARSGFAWRAQSPLFTGLHRHRLPCRVFALHIDIFDSVKRGRSGPSKGLLPPFAELHPHRRAQVALCWGEGVIWLWHSPPHRNQDFGSSNSGRHSKKGYVHRSTWYASPRAFAAMRCAAVRPDVPNFDSTS